MSNIYILLHILGCCYVLSKVIYLFENNNIDPMELFEVCLILLNVKKGDIRPAFKAFRFDHAVFNSIYGHVNSHWLIPANVLIIVVGEIVRREIEV